VIEKSQSLNADFMLITTWSDPRLAIKTAPAMTLYGTDVFDKGLIWGPKLTFANRRDLTNPIDGVVRTYNTGKVQVVQRYLATYAMNFNMRDFPFDTQTFTWNIRSTTFDKRVMVFSPQRNESLLKNTSLLLQNVTDPTFVYSNYNQTTYTLTEGIFTGYHLLSVTIDARRLATMSSIFLIFPICILCSALCLVFSQEPANNARLSVPLGVITSTLAFSYVVGNQCPPVSYTTRIHLMIFFTYCISIVILIINYYLWAIEFAKKELARLNGEKKNLLMDAHWMPRKIGATPQKVIVLPEGVYKPKEEPKKEPAAKEEVGVGSKTSTNGIEKDASTTSKDSVQVIGSPSKAGLPIEVVRNEPEEVPTEEIPDSSSRSVGSRGQSPRASVLHRARVAPDNTPNSLTEVTVHKEGANDLRKVIKRVCLKEFSPEFERFFASFHERFCLCRRTRRRKKKM
jgi:hypothetical protein